MCEVNTNRELNAKLNKDPEKIPPYPYPNISIDMAKQLMILACGATLAVDLPKTHIRNFMLTFGRCWFGSNLIRWLSNIILFPEKYSKIFLHYLILMHIAQYYGMETIPQHNRCFLTWRNSSALAITGFKNKGGLGRCFRGAASRSIRLRPTI